MDRMLYYTISDESDGISVLDFLRREDFSRNILHSMKSSRQNLIRNGAPCFGTDLLKKADVLKVRVPETEFSEEILPVNLSLCVLYEDEDLLVVDKPSGMPVHPSIGNYDNTLANAVAWYQISRGEQYPFRCINRLDRDTTGALILAKNPYSAAILGRQIRNREITRTYLALVTGELPESGTIDVPIRRKEASVIERVADPERGERAVTHYRRLAYNGTYSLAEIHLETGRTHQIRVHMKSLGHPLPGDYLYHPEYSYIQRQPLHSHIIEFTHPVTKQPMKFISPLPEDMKNAWESSSH